MSFGLKLMELLYAYFAPDLVTLDLPVPVPVPLMVVIDVIVLVPVLVCICIVSSCVNVPVELFSETPVVAMFLLPAIASTPS